MGLVFRIQERHRDFPYGRRELSVYRSYEATVGANVPVDLSDGNYDTCICVFAVPDSEPDQHGIRSVRDCVRICRVDYASFVPAIDDGTVLHGFYHPRAVKEICASYHCGDCCYTSGCHGSCVFSGKRRCVCHDEYSLCQQLVQMDSVCGLV